MINGRVHFIVGMSRCGITPLSRCLNLHPAAAVFGESRFFGRCYVEPASADGYDSAQLNGIERMLRNFRWTATVGDELGCLRNLSLEDMHDLIADTFGRLEAPIPPGALFTLLAERIADAEGKHYAFEKTPHHLNMLGRIVTYVPDAHFVVLLCEPYAFCRFHREWDASYHPLGMALLWRGYMRAYERAAQRYADRIVVIDTAGLAHEGAATLERVQRFFGLELHDLAAPLAPLSVFFERPDETDAADIFWINLICRRLMRRHGYYRRPTPRLPRPVLLSLVSFPRWCLHGLGWGRRSRLATTWYLLRWLRP